MPLPKGGILCWGRRLGRVRRVHISILRDCSKKIVVDRAIYVLYFNLIPAT
jgi:hypothetical protein